MRRRLSAIGFLLGVLAFSFSLHAQDLDREYLPDPALSLQRIEGLDPRIQKCRLSEKGALECVASEPLARVFCESYHFSKKTPQNGQVVNQSFRCPGTRFDRQSMMHQWTVALHAKNGARSLWRVDAIDEEQMAKLFKTELKSQSFLNQQRNYYFSLGAFGSYAGDSGQSQFLSGLKVLFGNASMQLGLNLSQAGASQAGANRNDVLLLGDIVLTSPEAGRGWLLGAEFGKKRWGGTSVDTQCLLGRYRVGWNSWKLQSGLGNCWFPGQGMSWGPTGEVTFGRYFWKHWLLHVETQAGYQLAAGQSGAESRLTWIGRLGVSFELFPE